MSHGIYMLIPHSPSNVPLNGNGHTKLLILREIYQMHVQKSAY